jgi:predicted oxidoreductase
MKAPLAVHQIEISLAHVAPLFDGTLDQAMERNIAIAAWSPLAGGRLGGTDTPQFVRLRETLSHIAERMDTSPSAVALAFLQRHPAPVTPILGTKTMDRLRDCLKASTLELSRADWYTIVEASLGKRMP